MSAKPRITGIGDEAAIALSGQLATAHDLGWSALELRTVGNTPLGELDSCEVAHLARFVRKSGLDIACLDSRIGNWARPVTTPFAADLRELDILSEQCTALDTRYVRIMSYPNDGLTENEWRDRVLERIARLTARARERGLVLLHENCAGWAGADPGRMLQLIDAAGSTSLQLLFDTGNGIGYGYDAAELLPALLPHIAHVHVKDGVGTPGNVQYVLPGDGRARVSTCLNWLLTYGYTGFFSLEPHLITRPHEGSTADETAPERFAEACYQLRNLLDQAAPKHAPGGTTSLGAGREV